MVYCVGLEHQSITKYHGFKSHFFQKVFKNMLQNGSLINSSDNSGALVFKFIRVLAKGKQMANLGDFYVGSIKEIKTSKVKKQFLKKGDLNRADQKMLLP